MRTISIVLDCGATMKILCFFVITIAAKLVDALKMANYSSVYRNTTIHLFRTAIMYSSLPLDNNREQQINAKIHRKDFLKFDYLQCRQQKLLTLKN
jgi:hypothetical protein